MQQACAEWFAVVWTDLKSVQWLEWAKVIFDLFKGIAWPLAIFMLVWTFRLQIRERIKDLISAGPGGAVFQPSQPVQAKQEGLAPLPFHPMKTVNDLAVSIKSEVDNLQENVREAALISSLAQARMEANFEAMYGVVFASQIEALRELAQNQATLDQAREYFETVVKPKSQLYETWGFEQWSQFLLAQKLVELDGNTIRLADLGRDFLLFIDTKKPGFHKAN